MKSFLVMAMVWLGGCTITAVPPGSSSFASEHVGSGYRYHDDDDESEEERCRRNYAWQQNLAAYNRQTAMTDDVRDFWAEDQRFYREQADHHCGQ